MKWEQDNSQYSNGKNLILGKWVVGSVFYDGAQPRDSKLYYGTGCCLPGIKKRFANFETEKEAQESVEFAVKYWIEKAGLKEIENG